MQKHLPLQRFSSFSYLSDTISRRAKDRLWELLSPVVLLDERRHPLGLRAQVPGVPHQVVQLPFQLLGHGLGALQALQRFLNDKQPERGRRQRRRAGRPASGERGNIRTTAKINK